VFANSQPPPGTSIRQGRLDFGWLGVFPLLALYLFAYKLNSFLVEVRHYLTAAGKDPYQQWLDKLKDLQGRVAIQRRVDRLAGGNFGDHKFCREGVWELRVESGPGYRVYYAREGQAIVILLCGGSKRTQSADIKDAVQCWRDYQRRKQ
jgi:putative addiction module killer protein